MSPETWDKCRTSIMKHEGFRATVYQDTLGYDTVGYGHLLTPKDIANNLVFITQNNAKKLLDSDMSNAEQEIKKTWPDYNDCDDVRQAVILEMCFQLGVSGVMQFKKFLAAVISKDYYLAESHMLDSLWARQTPNRAHDLAYRIVSGEF